MLSDTFSAIFFPEYLNNFVTKCKYNIYENISISKQGFHLDNTNNTINTFNTSMWTMFCKQVVKSHSSYITYNILFNCSHIDTFKYNLKLAFQYNRDGLLYRKIMHLHTIFMVTLENTMKPKNSRKVTDHKHHWH